RRRPAVRIAGMITGRVRDRLDGDWTPWRSNLVLWGAADVAGALLARRAGAGGLAFLAVGTGDGAWDATPPDPDKSRTALTTAVARVPLVAGDRLSYGDPGRRVVGR